MLAANLPLSLPINRAAHFGSPMLTQNLGTSSYPVSPYRSNSIVIVTSSLPCCRCVCWWGFLLLVPIKNGWCSLLLIPFYSFVIFVLEISRLKAAFGTLDLSSLLDTCCWCTVLFHRVPRCLSLPSPCRWSFHQRKSRTGEKHICPCSPLRSFPSYAQQLWCSSATWYSNYQKAVCRTPNLHSKAPPAARKLPKENSMITLCFLHDLPHKSKLDTWYIYMRLVHAMPC